MWDWRELAEFAHQVVPKEGVIFNHNPHSLWSLYQRSPRGPKVFLYMRP